MFQYCRYYIVRQIQAWHLLLSQQTSISYDTYGYNLQISKHWKSTSEADYCSWQQLWLCCAFVTEKQELCKSSGHGKRWLQDGKWQCKSKGGGEKNQRLGSRTVFIYIKIYLGEVTNIFFLIDLQTLHVKHIIETIKKVKGEQITAVGFFFPETTKGKPLPSSALLDHSITLIILPSMRGERKRKQNTEM